MSSNGRSSFHEIAHLACVMFCHLRVSSHLLVSRRAQTLFHNPRTKQDLREVERETIIHALERSAWKVAGTNGAALALGVPASTLASRMKALQIERPKSAEIVPINSRFVKREIETDENSLLSSGAAEYRQHLVARSLSLITTTGLSLALSEWKVSRESQCFTPQEDSSSQWCLSPSCHSGWSPHPRTQVHAPRAYRSSCTPHWK